MHDTRKDSTLHHPKCTYVLVVKAKWFCRESVHLTETQLTILCCSVARRYNSVTQLYDFWDGDLLASGVLSQEDQQLKDVPDQSLSTSAGRKGRGIEIGLERTEYKQKSMSIT